MAAARRLNFVTADAVLAARVSRQIGGADGYELTVSPAALETERFDGRVLPVEAFLADTEFDKTRLPTIAYGSRVFLRPAFLAGAADYLKDPWTLDELVLRLRKCFPARVDGPFHWNDVTLADGGIERLGRVLPLTRPERELFRALAENQGTPVPKNALSCRMESASGRDSRTVDVYVSRLRKKIRALVPDRPNIRSIRGEGYILD